MNQLRYPLRVNVGFLLNQPFGSYRDIRFEIDKFSLPPDFDVTGLDGVARFSRARQGIVVQANFKAKMAMQCVRCLADCQQTLQTEFSELYAFDKDSMSESGLILAENGNIDFAPLLGEYLLLEAPMRPLCRPDCKGLCAVCGEDLNQVTCEHKATVVSQTEEIAPNDPDSQPTRGNSKT